MAQAVKQNDPKWRAQESAYAAMEAEDPFEALRLAQEARKLDPDCTDVLRLMVWPAPTELDNVPHPISWTVFLIIIMQQPQGQAASDGPAAGIET